MGELCSTLDTHDRALPTTPERQGWLASGRTAVFLRFSHRRYLRCFQVETLEDLSG